MKKADGFDEAIIGVTSLWNGEDVLVYDYYKCALILETRDGMPEEDCIDFMEYNVIGSYVGEDTPIFVRVGDQVDVDL